MCPGLLSLPLVNFSAGAGGGARAAAVWAAAPPLLGAPAGGAGGSDGAAGGAAPPSPSVTTMYAGGAGMGVLLLFVLVLACTRRCPAAGVSLLKRVDAFSLRPPRCEGEPPTLRAAALGGVFTLMGVLTLTTYALYMVLDWRFNNTLVQRSLATLGEGSAAALLGGAAWAAVPRFGGGPTPLLLRVLADGEPGRCDAPLAWAGSGLAPGGGAWALASAPSVGGSGVAAHTFSCAGCLLSPGTALTASFHYSCQSLLLEAVAGAPGEEGGGDSVGGGPAPRTVAGAPGALLASVAWSLTPLLAVVSNNITARTYVGYSFTGSALNVALAPLAAPNGGGGGLLSVAPASAAVALSIALPLQTVYTQVTLTQRVPWTQLLANIVGLTGVLGFFGVLYGQFEKRFPEGGGGGGKRSAAAAATLFVAAPAQAAAAGEVAELQQRMAALAAEMEALAARVAGASAEGGAGLRLRENPLHRAVLLRAGVAPRPPAPPAAASGARGAVGTWRHESDGEYGWFKNSLSGEVAWELPPGAALEPSGGE